MSLKRIFKQGPIHVKNLESVLESGEFRQQSWYKLKSEARRPQRWKEGPYFCQIQDTDKLDRQTTLVIGIHKRQGPIYGFIDPEN